MTDFQIRREDWIKLTNLLENVDKTVTQLLEREKYRDGEIVRAQKTADKAMEVAYEAKVMAEKAELKISGTNTNFNRWQDWAFKISAALVVAGIAGIIGYMVAG